jgi:hypothetical protein
MANPLAIINSLNEVAYLAGLFNWQMSDGSYTNPDGSLTCSFHVVKLANSIPLAQYASGAIDAYNLIAGPSKTDPNQQLFNTQIAATGIRENITRKYTVNRIPFANYDQPVDLGTGTQRITCNVLFAGTMYQTAVQNFMQCAFGPQSGLGTLNHPFYNKIEKVLPVEFNTLYSYDSLNFVMCEVTFVTSNLLHLSPSNIQRSLAQKIAAAYQATQAALTSVITSVNVIKSMTRQIGASVGL